MSLTRPSMVPSSLTKVICVLLKLHALNALIPYTFWGMHPQVPIKIFRAAILLHLQHFQFRLPGRHRCLLMCQKQQQPHTVHTDKFVGKVYVCIVTSNCYHYHCFQLLSAHMDIWDNLHLDNLENCNVILVELLVSTPRNYWVVTTGSIFHSYKENFDVLKMIFQATGRSSCAMSWQSDFKIERQNYIVTTVLPPVSPLHSCSPTCFSPTMTKLSALMSIWITPTECTHSNLVICTGHDFQCCVGIAFLSISNTYDCLTVKTFTASD